MAHPDRVEATGETEEATGTRFNGDQDHGGADLVDDSVPATAVGKTSKQQVIEHHRNKVVLTAYRARAETDHGALVTVRQTRRWSGRP